MGQDNEVPRRINKVEGVLGQLMQSQGPGLVEQWVNASAIGVDYGLSFFGTVSGIAGAPKFQCSGLIGFGDAFFNGYWAYVVWDAGGAGVQPQGQKLICTGYSSVDADFTVAAFAPNVIAVGDMVLLLHPSIARVLDIVLDTLIRVIQSGVQAIGAAATEWLNIDSGTNGAEIISIAIAGINGHDWTLATYVPSADAVAAPVADDKRDTIEYLAADTEGGLLKPFGFAFNCFLQFTNDGGADQIDQVTVTYRSRDVLSLTWGP